MDSWRRLNPSDGFLEYVLGCVCANGLVVLTLSSRWLVANKPKWHERLSRLLTLYHDALGNTQALLDVLYTDTPVLTHKFGEKELGLQPTNLMRQGMIWCSLVRFRSVLSHSLRTPGMNLVRPNQFVTPLCRSICCYSCEGTTIPDVGAREGNFSTYDANAFRLISRTKDSFCDVQVFFPRRSCPPKRRSPSLVPRCW